MVRILVVDDNQSTAEFYRSALIEARHSVMMAHSTAEALAILDGQAFDIILSDVRMPGGGGMELLRRVSEHLRPPSVVLMTGYATVADAVEALKMGACDYIEKPLSREGLTRLVERLIQARARHRDNLLSGRQLDAWDWRPGLVGRSAHTKAVFESIRRVAQLAQPVLISGETGTGKEGVARAIHASSARKNPFVTVDCGTLSPSLAESELFGYVRGAFTGADHDRLGLLKTSSGGTLFLDQIAELPLALQVRLSRVLRDREFRPLGADCMQPFEGRVIAATNKDLEQAVREGAFRAELYFELNVYVIAVPPLRSHRPDILPLARRFLETLSLESSLTLTPEASALLVAYDWPGNVRELQNCIVRMAANRRGPTLDSQDIPSLFAPSIRLAALPALKEAEREVIVRILRETGGNVVQAACALGVSRPTLYRKIQALGLRHAKLRRP